MKVYLGLGSNTGNRRKNIEKAFFFLNKKFLIKKYSSLYETPAHLLKKSPEEWNKPFLNMVLEIESLVPLDSLLEELKKIESLMGRKQNAPKWSPRIIDIDILFSSSCSKKRKDLVVPHPFLEKREFVLSPFRDICPLLKVKKNKILDLSRKLKKKEPSWMDIFNLTPDSFSDGRELYSEKPFEDRISQKIKDNLNHFIQWIDVGAFSTRPMASVITPQEEWRRVSCFFKILKKFRNPFIKISVDTFRSKIAKKALSLGAEAINDVSGLSDKKMIDVLKDSDCDYILMHSLSVPVDKKIVFSKNQNVIQEIKDFLEEKLEFLEKNKVDLNRIIFDPGIGFGKTSSQSFKIIHEIDKFLKYPVRLMIGHSKKSFMSIFSKENFSERSYESIGLSLKMAQKGVDIIRVHEASQHKRAWLSYRHGEK